MEITTTGLNFCINLIVRYLKELMTNILKSNDGIFPIISCRLCKKKVTGHRSGVEVPITTASSDTHP